MNSKESYHRNSFTWVLFSIFIQAHEWLNESPWWMKRRYQLKRLKFQANKLQAPSWVIWTSFGGRFNCRPSFVVVVVVDEKYYSNLNQKSRLSLSLSHSLCQLWRMIIFSLCPPNLHNAQSHAKTHSNPLLGAPSCFRKRNGSDLLADLRFLVSSASNVTLAWFAWGLEGPKLTWFWVPLDHRIRLHRLFLRALHEVGRVQRARVRLRASDFTVCFPYSVPQYL